MKLITIPFNLREPQTRTEERMNERICKLATIAALYGALAITATLAYGAECRVNLNSATAEQLQALPGIGEAKADTILRAREEGWSCKEPAGLAQVHGFGEKTAAKLRAAGAVCSGDTQTSGCKATTKARKFGAPKEDNPNR